MARNAAKNGTGETGSLEQRDTANETVYRTLQREIAAGELSPGTQLVHRRLAQRLGTSTIPVIDALRRLEGAGLLVSTPGMGTRVRHWEPHEIYEAYLVRAAHEGVACRLFVERATRDEIALLEALNAAFDTAARAGNAVECDAIDEQLHAHIAVGARSHELSRLVENSGLALLTIRNSMLPPEVVSTLEAGPAGIHAGLVEVLKGQDPDAAEREGRAHVLTGWAAIGARLAEHYRHLRMIPG